MSDRYFIDERVGCIAVRDRIKTDPDYSGLHDDTEGVVAYWGGKSDEDGYWHVDEIDIASAEKVCIKLNEPA